MTAAPRELGNSRIATVRAPAGGVTAWSGVQIGYLFGVAVEDQPIDGGPVPLAVQGVWELPKEVGLHLDTGDVAYWDQANACVTNMHTGNLAIGVCVYDAKDPKDVIDVFLAPSIPDAGGQERIELVETIMLDLVPAAYGAMTLEAVPEPFTIPTTGFNPIIQFDTVDITGRGCSLDASDGTISIDTNLAGVWKFIYSFTLSFTQEQQGRTFYFQFYNVTDSQPAGNPVYIPAGRNQDGIQPVTLTFLARIDATATNKKFQGQLGDASASLSNVMLQNLSFDAHFTDRLANLIDPIAGPPA